MARTWFITGISNGFGRQLAEQLLARGDRVAGTTRRPGSVTDLAARYGDHFWVAELDLTDFARIPGVIDKAFAEFGRIDVVVNNAGYGQFGAAEAMSDAQISEQIDTNLIGPIHLARAALPHLRAQGGGRLVAMSSYGGQATHPGASLYHASKWGLEGFFDALAAEVAPFGIKVNIVEPGSARTGFRSQAGVRLGRELEAYRDTPIGAIRSRLSDPSAAGGGDPARMVRLLIECLDEELAPKRIVLGGDAYRMIETALRDRLSALEAQKAVAIAADSP